MSKVVETVSIPTQSKVHVARPSGCFRPQIPVVNVSYRELPALQEVQEAQEVAPISPDLSSIPSYAYAAALLSSFSLIASDVNVPNSLHLLQPLDSFVHQTVSSNVPFEVRLVADKLISDTPINLGMSLILASLVFVTANQPKRGLALTGTLAFFNYAFAGIGFGKDASATTALKHFFSRARPSSDLHHTFSFPSGHSTSVYFVLGFLFFVMVPAVNATLTEMEAGTADAATDPDSISGRMQNVLKVLEKPEMAAALTVGGGVITQSGRVIADVHWMSDVAAGALWGSTGVAFAVVLLEYSKSMARKAAEAIE